MECIKDEYTNVSWNDNVLDYNGGKTIYTGDTNGTETSAHHPGVAEFTLGF